MREVRLIHYNNDDDKEIEIINIDKTQRISSTVNSPYRTDFYQIIWLKQGVLKAKINFEEIVLQPNTILFLNKNKIQSYTIDGDVSIDLILFTDIFYNKYMIESSRIERSLLFNDLIENSFIRADNPQFQAVKNILVEEYYNQSDTFSLDILRNQLHSFILLAEREVSKSVSFNSKSVEIDLYLQFTSLLNKKYKVEKGVTYYCDQLKVSEKRLNRAVAKVSSRTPKTIIQNKVILEAKWLLCSSELSVKEIAFELGFSESTNFIKYFKKHTSVNPSEYAKSGRV